MQEVPGSSPGFSKVPLETGTLAVKNAYIGGEASPRGLDVMVQAPSPRGARKRSGRPQTKAVWIEAKH
jgi:hypothetical protein